MAGIQIKNVFKNYGKLNVLKEFSLDIQDGEFIVLVGPSGCGKSTMLKILAGLEASSGGQILIGENDVTDVSPGQRDIAMVFQNYALYPHLSVKQNIGFGLKMRKISQEKINQKVSEASRILSLEKYLERKPKDLSGGQRQRVALGRAIVREPKAFLMDEPLSNLDAKLRLHMRTEISALHKRIGVTTIYVTHDQIEAMTMADRVVIMKNGEIQQIASPDDLFNQPANLFVASFIGSPGMNFFSVKPVTNGNECTAKLLDCEIKLPEKAANLSEVIVGIRPEHFKLEGNSHSFQINPTLIESLGSEKYLYFRREEESNPTSYSDEEEESKDFVARVSYSGHLDESNSMQLFFQESDLFFFDPQTQNRIVS